MGARPPDTRGAHGATEAPLMTVVVEVPRWGFVKRGANGHVDFVSPLPCPFNYGSVPGLVGLEGDLLDALVLGPRLARGTRLEVHAFGAIGFLDRGIYDDKLVCWTHPPGRLQRRLVVVFFHCYALAKGLLNVLRGRPGRMGCTGWGEAVEAIDRAVPREPGWQGPKIRF